MDLLSNFEQVIYHSRLKQLRKQVRAIALAPLRYKGQSLYNLLLTLVSYFFRPIMAIKFFV